MSEVEGRVVTRLSCPVCGSGERRRAGVAAGAGGPVQRWRCKECGRYYLASCRRRVVTPAERRIAARLLRQAVAPRVIARALEVSEQWVYLLRRRLRDDNPAGLREKAGAGF